jgi:hypothetical protein
MSRRVENFIKEEVLKIKDKGGLKKNIVEKKDISVEKHTFSRYC